MAENEILDGYFGFLQKALTPLGLWPFATTTVRESLQILRSVAFITIVSCICIAECFYITDEQQFNSFTLMDIIENCSLVITALISIIKASCHVINRPLMRNILEALIDLSKDTPQDEKINRSTKTSYKNSQFISKFLFSTCFGCIFIYAWTAWMDYYLNGNYTLPYPIKIFFEINSPERYIPIFFIEFFASTGVTLCFVGDTMFSAIILFVCTRIDVLKYLIRKTMDERDDQKSLQMFMNCVEYHKRILKIFEMMESYYSPILITQFLLSTILICLLCFLGTQDTDLMNKGFMIALYFVSIVWTLFMFCYYGQQIETKWLTDEVFHSPWFESSITNQKRYQFFLLRSSVRNTLMAYRFMPCNLGIFHDVIKTSLSYYTLLLSMKNESR